MCFSENRTAPWPPNKVSPRSALLDWPCFARRGTRAAHACLPASRALIRGQRPRRATPRRAAPLTINRAARVGFPLKKIKKCVEFQSLGSDFATRTRHIAFWSSRCSCLSNSLKS